MSRLVINLRESRPLWSVPDWAVDEITNAAPRHLDVVVVDTPADGRGDGGAASPEAIAAIEGAEIYIAYGFPRDLFLAAQRSGDSLRWVHSAAAGVAGAMYPEMVESRVLLTNSAGIHAEPMADTIMAMIHYFARGLDFAVSAQKNRLWLKDPFNTRDTPVRELEGLTLGILGYGGIGRATAARARALGMKVLGHRRKPGSEEEGVTQLHGPDGLDRLLRESDFVVVALPHTPETATLLDGKRLALLRSDAVLVNVGRGEVVDEQVLLELLATGSIRGAALDVFVREPLPADSPFWILPNVLITPHVSPTTNRFWRRQVDLIRENLEHYQRGEPLRNLVDKTAGY